MGMSVGQSLLALLLFTALPLSEATDMLSKLAGDESIMSPKAHGTCTQPVATNLRWNCDFKTADRECCFNRHYAEYAGFWTESANFLESAEVLRVQSHFMTQSLFCRYSSLLEGVAGVTSLKKAKRTDGQALETTKFCRSTCAS